MGEMQKNKTNNDLQKATQKT